MIVSASPGPSGALVAGTKRASVGVEAQVLDLTQLFQLVPFPWASAALGAPWGFPPSEESALSRRIILSRE